MRLTGDRKRKYIGEKRERETHREREGQGKIWPWTTYVGQLYSEEHTCEGKRQYDLAHAYKRRKTGWTVGRLQDSWRRGGGKGRENPPTSRADESDCVEGKNR